MNSSNAPWASCSSCKKSIEFGAIYYECSVSTCTSKRTGYVFCSLGCWEVHLPTARHKDASAIEERAPKDGNRRFEAADTAQNSPARRIIRRDQKTVPVSGGSQLISRDILIVASKLKSYVAASSGINTSANVMERLSDIVRRETDKAIECALAEGRKTLLDRDFK